MSRTCTLSKLSSWLLPPKTTIRLPTTVALWYDRGAGVEPSMVGWRQCQRSVSRTATLFCHLLLVRRFAANFAGNSGGGGGSSSKRQRGEG